MKLFKKASAMYAAIADMENDESDRREDRATVSNFFNGGPPLTDEEAEELGFTVNVNHLFGFADLADSAEQLGSFLTKPINSFMIELDTAPPGKAADWGMQATTEACRVFKKIFSFKTHYLGCVGDVTMHGEGVFHFTSKTFPAPKQAPLSKMLVPKKSSTDIDELTYFAREGTLSLRTLHRIAKHKPKGWKVALVNKLLKKTYEKVLPDGAEVDPNNLEEIEYQRQENSGKHEAAKIEWDVYYFYQRRGDLHGEPYDLTILLKDHSNHVPEGESDDKNDGIVYQNERCYGRAPEIIQPIFMDTIIGGESKWHRVMGQGHLNYSLFQSVEMLLCRAHQGTMEASMNLWHAKDTATREAMEQIIMRHNGILPEGVQPIVQRYEPNFTGIQEMIQLYRQQGARNARGQQPNIGDRNDQLEIQAAFEQNRAASSVNNRAANLYDYLDRMATEVVRRLTNPYIDSREDGYSEVMDFQAAMERRGIPLFYLQPPNVRVRWTRIIGDGLRSKELAAASFLSQNRAQFAPQVQPKITRIITALSLDSYQTAEELTPMQEEPDVPQQMRAEAENSIMLTQRKPQTPKADDIDELHVIQHFPAMEILVQDGIQFQNAAFTPQQAQAFHAIGSHIVMHIQRIEGKAQNSRQDANREQARAFKEQLNAIVQMGQKLMNNLQQQQEAGKQEPPDPVEMARLQLDIEKLQLAREKMAFSVQKFDRQQSARESDTSFNQMMKMEENRRADRESRHDSSLADVDMALQIARPKSTSNGER